MAGRGGGGFLVGLPVEVVMLSCSVQAQRLDGLFVPRLASRATLRHLFDVSPVPFKFSSVVGFNLVISKCQRTQIETRTNTYVVVRRGG